MEVISDKPFEFIGLDTCLMGHVDTGYWFIKMAHLLIATTEIAPAGGWRYQWLKTLSLHTETNPYKIAKLLIDEYYEVNKSQFFGKALTMSITNLDYFPPVRQGLDQLL